MSINFDAEDKPLSSIIEGEEKYKIPRYQRPYSWTIDEVSDLWNDLKDDETFFMGSFVFNYENYEKDKFVEVIDGQQRLITITILMAVLRDLYKGLGDERKAMLTQTRTIAHEHSVSGEQDYRLRCGDTLNEFFCANIQKEASAIFSVKPVRREEKNVKENYKFLKEKIQDELGSYPEKSRKIKFLDDLKQRIFDIRIIWIKIGNEDDAYSIFETVNARGADLTAADLIKNYLFSKIPVKDGIDRAKASWTAVENNIENAKGALNVSKFMRYYWLSKYSFTPEKKIYKEIKKEIRDPGSFLLDIEEASDYYYKIANESINSVVWVEELDDKKMGERIYEAINGLRAMEITQCYSLLFCLLMNKEKIGVDFSRIFEVIENYHFAYSAICKLSGNVVERIYFNASKRIQEALKIQSEKTRDKNIQKALSEFEMELKEKYPSKTIFAEKFADIEYKNYPLVIYILSKIDKAKGVTQETNINFTKVNIEHILPQDPVEWGLRKGDIKEYVNKLGNLTLIAKKINGSMGNKPLKEKAKLFNASKLNINKDLFKGFVGSKYKWGEVEIAERQKELAEYAYDHVWKFK